MRQQRNGWNTWKFAHHHFDTSTRDVIASRDGDEDSDGTIGLEILDDVFDAVTVQREVGALTRGIDANAFGGREDSGNGSER
jgi:hypothetical protein